MKNEFEIRGDVTIIFLDRKDGSRLECLIDTVDLERAQEFEGKWCVDPREDIQSYYVMGVYKGKSYRIHRWIMNPPPDKQVDHINNKGWDNGRSNLRIVTQSENQQNRRTRQSNNKSSGVRGVTRCSKTGNWSAHISVNNKNIWLGNYLTIEEAEKVVTTARALLMPNSKEANSDKTNLVDITKQLQGLKPSVNNKSTGARGVYFDSRYGTWQASINVNKKHYSLGTYKTKEEAVQARLRAEVELKGGKKQCV